MADVLAERESSRECAWVGELGAWAQFRTIQLPSRRETQHESSIQREPRETPANRRAGPGSRAACSWGELSTLRLALEAKLFHLRGLENAHPGGGKRRWDFSWGRNRTPPARDNGSKSLNNSTPVDEGTQHPGDRV